MNTHDSSATVRARVGLVELPELAGMLQTAGLQTITGPNFREAATEIKEGFKESTFPILVADASTPGLRAWIQRIHNTAASAGKPVHIAVLREGGAPVITSEDVIELHTPLTLNEVLAAVRIPPVPGGDAVYPAPAAVQVPESAGIDFDFDFDDLADEDPVQQAVTAPAPAVESLPWEAPAAPAAEVPWEAPVAADAPWEAPAAAATAQPPVDEDPWSTPATPAAPATDEQSWDTPSVPAPTAPAAPWEEPAPVQTSAPAADEFDWNTPVAAPTPAATPESEFDWADPVPASTPAAPPADDFEWNTPAVPAAAAKVAEFDWDASAEAPAAPAAAPAPAPDIDWGTPAAATEPAPAPAAPVVDEWDAAFPATTPKDDVDWAAPAAPSAPEEPAALAASEWDTAFPAPEQPAIDWGTPATAQVAPAAAPEPAAESVTIDWGTPVAAPVPQTDRPEPRTEQRTFTPAPPAAAQPSVPAPVASFQQVPAPEQVASVHYLDPAQQQAARTPAREMTQNWADQAPAQQVQYRAQPAGPRGELIVDYSGKGGVGKSTTSLRLATIAADAGLKVILIDGNAAQGDLRTYMKLHRSNLPTIYDAAFGDVSKAVLRPDVINENREPSLGKVNFAFVAAAPDELYDKDVVTDAVYGQVIDYCRQHADLVILDTQIVEAADRSGVVDDIILPALVQDGWGIGISDMSSPGVNNLNHRLHKFIQSGVPTERLMVLLNRVPEKQVAGATKADQYFNGRATFLGVVEEDFQVSSDMNAGRMEVSNINLNAALNQALYTITGNEAFAPVKEDAAADVSRSIFKRFFGSGKKEVA